MLKNGLCIEVLGTSITISTDESADYLNNLLGNYKKALENTRNTAKLTDPLKIAILTGFLLCDEAQKTRVKIAETMKEEDPDAREAETLMQQLISQMDDLLGSGALSIAAEKPSVPAAGAEDTVSGDPPSRPGIFKLKNTVKNYTWGSSEWIPGLLGAPNPSQAPWAELWMGVHPEGPSRLAGNDEKNEKTEAALLSSLIAKDPVYGLGEETAKAFGVLPFLFKVLAADKPLSIQAHPNQEQAREGWERENREGVDIKAPNRNYKDPNHKPEIICALSPFTAMCGFRTPEEIRTLLESFSRNAPSVLRTALESLISALAVRDRAGPLKSFLQAVFSMGEETRRELSAYARTIKAGEDAACNHEWKLIARFAELYPADPAVIAPLYLNLIELKPGEAVYLPAGVLHAYVRGLGVELMADSDNVLRGGLTPKHIDLGELFRVLKFSPFKPQILKAPAGNTANSAGRAETACFKYPAPCREFSLSSLKGGNGIYTEDGPSIILVTGGELKISCGGEELVLRQGESAFVPAGTARQGLSFSGNYTAYAAGTGNIGPLE